MSVCISGAGPNNSSLFKKNIPDSFPSSWGLPLLIPDFLIGSTRMAKIDYLAQLGNTQFL